MLKIMFIFLLCISNFAQAHVVMGVNKADAEQGIKIVEEYFYQNYGIKLEREVAVINEPNMKAYRKRLEEFKVNEAAKKAARSQAITSKGRAIVIDCGRLRRQEYLFFLAHEMVHQYQFQARKKDALQDMVMLEGLADIEASRISGYGLEIADYKIPYENLKSYEDYEKSIAKYGGRKVARQIRYYVKDMDFSCYMEK